MKICFPARKANGDNYATVDDMMQPLFQEPHGSWLAGTNNMWHGGIHITRKKAGAKLIANLGEVEMHSRHNTLDMSAQKQLTITSTDDEIVISTPKTLTVNGGGSYLKLSDSGIEHGSKGDLTMKVGDYLVPGSGGDLPFDAPDFKTTEIAEMTNIISKPLSN